MTATAALTGDQRPPPTAKEQKAIHRWKNGRIPRVVPIAHQVWKTVGMGRRKYYRVTNPVERQVLAYNAAVKAEATMVIDVVKRRLARVRHMRAQFLRTDRLPVDDLLDAFAKVQVDPPPPTPPRRKRHKTSDVRTLLENVSDGSQLIPGADRLEDGSIFTTTAALAAHLSCSKATIHGGLRRLKEYGAINFVPTRKGTRIMLLRRRGEPVGTPVTAGAERRTSTRLSLPRLGRLRRALRDAAPAWVGRLLG